MGPPQQPFFAKKEAKKPPASSRAEPERQACGPSWRKWRSFAFPRAGNGGRAKALGSWSYGASGAPFFLPKKRKKASRRRPGAACGRCPGSRNGSQLRGPGSFFRAMGKNEREKGPTRPPLCGKPHRPRRSGRGRRGGKSRRVGKWSLRGKDAEPEAALGKNFASLGQGARPKAKNYGAGAMGPPQRPFFAKKEAKKPPASSRAEPERQACGPSWREWRSLAFPRAGNGGRAKLLGSWS